MITGFKLKPKARIEVHQHLNKPRTKNRSFKVKVARWAESIDARISDIKAEIRRIEDLREKIDVGKYVIPLIHETEHVHTNRLIRSLRGDLLLTRLGES